MTATPTALALALAGAALAAAPERPPAARLHRAGVPRVGPGTGRAAASTSRRRPRPHRVLAALVATAVALLAGMPWGPPVGMLAGWGAVRLCARLEPAAADRTRRRRAAEFPAVLDLIGVCLAAGLPLASALDLVATALPGEFSDDLRTVAGLHRLGAGPAVAWSGVRGDKLLGPVARAAIRSGDSGSALARALDRLAAELRADGVVRCESRARRAGVVAMAPLGLCFLPAFVCLGVVPVTLGIAGEVLGTALTGPH